MPQQLPQIGLTHFALPFGVDAREHRMDVGDVVFDLRLGVGCHDGAFGLDHGQHIMQPFFQLCFFLSNEFGFDTS